VGLLVRAILPLNAGWWAKVKAPEREQWLVAGIA
jgi:hypothetical protein